MSEHPKRKFDYLGTSEQQEIPAPPDLTERGFREIARIWRKPPDKNNGERINAVIRGTYASPGEWNMALATMARTLAGLYFEEGSALDRDRMACALLGGALSRIAAEQPDLNADLIEADIGDLYADDKPKVEILPPDPAPVAEQPAPPPEQAHVPAIPMVMDMDERAIPVPETMLAEPRAVHILTIWMVPETPPCPDCPACGIDHEGQTYIGIHSDRLSDKAMGRTLGTVAKLHVQLRTDDATKRAIALGNVQQHFHGFLVEGLPRA